MNKITLSYSKPKKCKTIYNSENAVEIMRSLFDLKTIELFESFHAIFLDHSNQCLGSYCLGNGGTSSCAVDLKHLAAAAILSNCSYVIVAHNHPSGRLTPSKLDKLITAQIKEGLNLFEIKLIDSLIMTKKGANSILFQI